MPEISQRCESSLNLFESPGAAWRRRSAVALLMLLAAVAGPGNAQAPAADIYSAVAPVAEQSTAELRRGAGLGLREVLVRVSGHGDVVRSAALADALGDAGRYLDQYRYERNTATEPGAAPLQLQMRFSPNSVTQLLRGAGLPVWSGNRPALQLWLAADEDGRRQIVDERSPLAAKLRAQAQRRGLVLRFPADPRALPLDEVWQLDSIRPRAAALAGAGEVVVLGNLVLPASGRCSGRWVVAAGALQPVRGEGDTADACIVAGIDTVVDALAQQYASATAASAGGDVMLRVAEVRDFNAYSALLVYLKQVGSIKSASPVQVQGDSVLLRLQLEGGAEQLARQLTLDNRLEAAVAAAAPVDPAAAPQPVLQYRWLAKPG